MEGEVDEENGEEEEEDEEEEEGEEVEEEEEENGEEEEEEEEGESVEVEEEVEAPAPAAVSVPQESMDISSIIATLVISIPHFVAAFKIESPKLSLPTAETCTFNLLE